MKVLFGREGFAASPAGRKILELEPSWDLRDGAGDAFRSRLADVDVVCPIGEPVTADAVSGTSVRLVQQFGVGTDAIDLDGLARLGVPVANLPGDTTGNADSVAELAVYFTLALIRQVEPYREAARAGRFASAVAPAIAGRRILIVGLGAIGTSVASRLAPFGATLIGIRADPSKGGVPGVDEVHAPSDLTSQLGLADVVILCAPAGDSGTLLDASAIGALKAGAYVVNVGRGALVDEDALLAALDSGAVGGAGLDVLKEEPPRPGHPLVAHPAVIVTPHIGGATLDSMLASAERFVENVRRLGSSEGPSWVRNGVSPSVIQ